MEPIIKETTDKESALAIAISLPEYFNESGLEQIRLALNSEKLVGAFDDDKMVGFVTYKEENAQVLELTWTAVLKEYQGKSIGTKLVIESLSTLSGYKFCKVKTLADTAEDSGYEKTRNFWQKLGFIPIEVIDPYPGWEPGNPCVIMVKAL